MAPRLFCGETEECEEVCVRKGGSYVGCVRACVHGMGWEVYHFLFDPEKVASGVHGGHDA